MPRVSLLVVLVALSTPLFGSSLGLGPEHELAPFLMVPDPSSQSDPAAAFDGERVLAVWSERRDGNPAPRIYAALLDDDGSVLGSPLPVSAGDAGQTKPHIAFGAGRHLVTWNEGAAVVAQFVRRDGRIDGDTFVVASTSSSPELVWNGAQFVLIWSSERTLHSMRVSPAGEVTSGPVLETDANVTLADLAAGPGTDVAALYRAENAARMSVRTAVLRADWSYEQILISVKRPCSSLACDDYFPMAIGWSGARYVAVWMKTGGPGRPSFIESSADGQTPRRLVDVASYPTDIAGEMLWSGASFLFVYRSHGISSSWLQTHVLRFTDDGESLESPMSGGPRLSSITSNAGSPPDVALVGPNRAVVVYNRDPVPLSHLGTPQRVLARSVTINPRRRAVR